MLDCLTITISPRINGGGLLWSTEEIVRLSEIWTDKHIKTQMEEILEKTAELFFFFFPHAALFNV